jgi:excisionase family DNA binding protein
MVNIADKNYYRPDELAHAVDVSVDTVRRWMDQNLIKHVHIVGVVRIPRAEFIRILNDGLPKKG